MTLSERQHQVLEVIRSFTEAQGFPPTIREIGAAVGLSSPATVHNHLRALEEQGLIRRGAAKRRALELLDGRGPRSSLRSSSAVRTLPLVGRVAAGVPQLATESIEEYVELPTFLAPAEDCFLLRVRGSSMINAGILDGDLVAVHRQETADNGDIVVAMVEEDATVKRFFREGGQVRLQPENDAMKPIVVPAARILGRVVSVMRRL
ncbi:MAG: transcriptional repressor LexA [Gaiellales bacterium]|nr:transcriptional repressor LexA [Gaiellales bacterium]